MRVPVGIVIVPLFDIDEITGLVSVLLVSVCVPVKVVMLVESAESDIDEVGKVTVPVTERPVFAVKSPREITFPDTSNVDVGLVVFIPTYFDDVRRITSPLVPFIDAYRSKLPE